MERKELITLKAGKYPNMHIYLTDKGREYITTNIVPIIEVENKVLAIFPDNEFDSLIENYSKYIKVFRTEVKKFK